MNFKLVTKELDIIEGVVENGRRLRSRTPRLLTFQSCRRAVDETKEQGLPRDERLEVLFDALLKRQKLSASRQFGATAEDNVDRRSAKLDPSSGQLQTANNGRLVRPLLLS